MEFFGSFVWTGCFQLLGQCISLSLVCSCQLLHHPPKPNLVTLKKVVSKLSETTVTKPLYVPHSVKTPGRDSLKFYLIRYVTNDEAFQKVTRSKYGTQNDDGLVYDLFIHLWPKLSSSVGTYSLKL